MRKLPPFPELVAFEAVARHLSFTRAAAELCITQSAVSHRVRRLEKHFGMQLIRRHNPGISLTEGGTALLPKLALVLDQLANLGGKGERRLRVAAGSALCTWWLAGRLATFMKARPGISVELIPIENDVSGLPDVDVRILWMSDAELTESPSQLPLGHELVFPVCSPRLLGGQGTPREAGFLATCTLLHKAAPSTGEWSWEIWLERLGTAKRGGGELRFADMGLVLSAAVEGSGVALARSLLAHDALADGRLVVPCAVEPLVSSKKHVARWRRERKDDPDINAFVEWLAAEVKSTLTDTERLLQPKLTRTAA